MTHPQQYPDRMSQNNFIALSSTLFTLDLSHPGIRATQKLITARFVWLGINTHVRKWTKSCLECQHSKVLRHTVKPLSTFATPDARFNIVHIDIIGPLQSSIGYTYLLLASTHSQGGQKPYLLEISQHNR